MGIISCLGALAAGLTWMQRRRSKDVAAVVPLGGETETLSIEEEGMTERPYCGPDGNKIVDEIVADLIGDARLRQRWTEFDGHFLRLCIEGGDQGLVFSRKGFEELEGVDGQLLKLGVEVYNKASQEATRRRHTCYRALNILAMAYLAATRAVR